MGLASHRVSTQGQDWKYSLARRFSKVPFVLSLMLLFGELSVTRFPRAQRTLAQNRLPAAPARRVRGATWAHGHGHFGTKCNRIPIPGLPELLSTFALLCFLPSSGAHFPVGPRALRLSHASPLPGHGDTSPACLSAYLSATRARPGPQAQHSKRSQTLQEVGYGVRARPVGSVAKGEGSPGAPQPAFDWEDEPQLGAKTGARVHSQKRPLSSIWAGPSGADGGSLLPRKHPMKD